MNKAIKITSDKHFNGYSVSHEESCACLSRVAWNYSAKSKNKYCGRYVTYVAVGFVNGIFTKVELRNYREAKRLYLAMCKA